MGRSVDENSVIKIVTYECGEFVGLAKEIEKQIKALPSAQPEIIMCNDCKYYTTEVGDSDFALGFCPFVNSHLVMSKGFCAWAERRQNEINSRNKIC